MSATMNQDALQAFLAEAAAIATEARAQVETAKVATEKAANLRGEASQALKGLQRNASGFLAPRLTGIASVGTAFAQRFNDSDSQAAVESAMKAAVSFLSTFTGATEKSIEGGGRKNGVANLIRAGANGKVILESLQHRLDYWQAIADAPDGENAKEQQERREQAQRYLALADSDKKDPKSGAVIKKAKYLGRPAVMVNGIQIGEPGKAGGGANRDSQVAQAAALYRIHGEKFLHPDVLDAFLDNGGKAEPDAETVAARAKRIGHELAEMLEQAIAVKSPHAAMLKAAIDTLDTIATADGFVVGKVAKGQNALSAKAKPAPVEAENKIEAKPEDLLDGELDMLLDAKTPAPAKPAKGKKGGLSL